MQTNFTFKKTLTLPPCDLDEHWPELEDDGELILEVGEYWMSGLKTPRRFRAQFNGATIKLMPSARNPARMFTDDGQWSNLFILEGPGILDGNWETVYKSAKRGRGNFKVEPVALQTTKGFVSDITVRNFGSDGGAYAEGLEAFPLSLNTYSSGPPFQYDAALAYLREDSNDWSELRIERCEVKDGHFIDGGYCTAIFARTNFPSQGDRQPYGVRTTNAATIRDCRVQGLAGIAYGSAISENLLFENNTAIRCKCGVNIDTGEIRNVRFIGNRFLGCNQGMNLTPYPQSRDIVIKGNAITLTAPFFNPVTRKTEDFYYINAPRLGLNEAKLREENHFASEYDPASPR